MRRRAGRLAESATDGQEAKRMRYRSTEDGSSEKNVMFPMNPDENWGPKRKHGALAAKEEQEKKAREA